MAANEKVILTAIVLDFETGGLDPKKAAATQLSMHAIRLDTFEVLETFNKYIAPYRTMDFSKPKKKVLKTKWEEEEEAPLMEYSEKAAEYSGITIETLYQKGEELVEVCKEGIEFVKRNTLSKGKSAKPFLVGQNILFDLSFLQQIYTYAGLWDEFSKLLRSTGKDFFGNQTIYTMDTILLSQLAFAHVGMDSWSLSCLCEKFGIDLDDAHDADADVIATREVLRLSAVRMRNEELDDINGSTVVTKKVKLREHFKI